MVLMAVAVARQTGVDMRACSCPAAAWQQAGPVRRAGETFRKLT